MTRLILSFMLLLLCMSCSRADVGTMFEDYLWQNRLVLVFSPRANDERLTQQREFLTEAANGLKTRDIIQWEFVYLDSVNVDGQQKVHLSTKPFYNEFDIGIRDFAVILIGKDGEVKHRTDKPIASQELFSIIDAMPMRQGEIEQAQ